MPELPEVESIVRGLRANLVGHVIDYAELAWPGAVHQPAPDSFLAGMVGREIVDIRRRAKYIIVELTDAYLLVHLRMTGQLLVCPAARMEALEDPYVRAAWHLRGGGALLFRDVRKLGKLYLVADPAELVGELGPEPLADDFTPSVLGERLARRRQLKPALLDQRVVAGLGNIYVDEALWEARLHPLRSAATLTKDEIVRLHAAVQSVLRRAIDEGGTTLRDYRGCDGEIGQHQYSLAVYGRAGEACPRCGGTIRRIVVGQRGTHLCPACQPLDEVST